MPLKRDLLHVAGRLRRDLDGDASLDTLARRAGGEGDVKAGVLPGGPAAVAVHAGPYDQLSETYAALERWIEANGLRPAGAPWESYVTDPMDHPDPADWRTEVYWPVAPAS